MGIDGEDIKLFASRIVHLSLRVSHSFVQKHPYVSGTLLFLFILHIFLPSVLSFLFYSLPFFGLAVILLTFWTSKRSTTRVEKVGDKLSLSKQSTTTVNRTRASLRNATSRRQRFKDKSEKAWSTAAPTDASVGRTEESVGCDYAKAFVEVKETQSLACGNNASAHSTSADKGIEVSGQNVPILGSELLVKPTPVACDGSSSQTNKSDSGGDETKNDSSEEAEDEDEEEAQEDRNKAVQWTEDDQKNLMDLGLSEIERNRRLESLIARRRARKSYKRKVEDTALTVNIIASGHIPRIITTRNDPFDLLDGSKDLEGLPLPGSAPSVLLPMRNPFDLPYDPHEEKPNLMADSFQQEFTAAHQKELSFCRHESFCYGPVYPLGDEGGGLGYHTRYRRPSIGDHDWLIEQLLFKGDQVSRPENNPDVAETGDDKRRSALPSDTTHVNATELESDLGKEIPADSESEFEMEPELTEDGNAQSSTSSSSENPEDVIICDDVAVVSQNFESTLSSALKKSLNCAVPKSRLIKEPLCEFSPTAFEKNKMDERFPFPDKVACHTPTYSIASDLQVEVSEIGSPPTVDGNNTDGESLNPDWEIEKEVNFGGEQDDLSPSLEEEQPNEVVLDSQEEEVKASSVLDALPPKAIQSAMIEELVDQPSQVAPQMPEELSVPTDDDDDDDEEAINRTINQKDADALANMENVAKTSEDIDGLEILTKQEDGGKKTGPLEEETDPKCSKSVNDHEHLEEGSRDLDQITGNGDLVEPNVMPIEIAEQLEFIPNNKNQPNPVENEFQSSKDALEATVEDELVTDGVPLDSSASLFMESSMKEQIHVNGSSLSNSNGIICSDGSQNQLHAIESEFQKSNNDAIKSTVEQDSVIEGMPRDSTARLSPKSSIEEQLHVDKVFSSQDCITSPEKPVEESIINENNPKTMEKDDSKPADSIEARSELIKDLSEQHDGEETDQNLSTPNPELNADLKMTENIVQGEVSTNPMKQIHITEVQNAISVTNKNMGSIENCEGECESHRFNKQESDIGEEKDLQFDKDMEAYSKDLNGSEAEGNHSKQKAHATMGLQNPTGSAHENSVDCSLSAEKGSQ